MDDDIIYSDILNLEKDILHIEETLVEFLNLKYEEGIKKSLHQLESNLRYLSILANGAPINKNEDRKIMDFLRIHYNYFKNYLYLHNLRYYFQITPIQFKLKIYAEKIWKKNQKLNKKLFNVLFVQVTKQ